MVLHRARLPSPPACVSGASGWNPSRAIGSEHRASGPGSGARRSRGAAPSSRLAGERDSLRSVALRLVRLLLALPLAALAAPGMAQSFPAKPVRLVVAQPAGGPTDAVGRLIAQALAEGLGQNVIVDNRVGAGGTVGTAHVARSKPDGYTLMVTSAGVTAIAPYLYPNVGYDPLADFVHISLLTRTVTVLVVPPSLPVKSVGDLVALARARPGRINMASGGNGTVSHLTGELFRTMAGIEVTHVPYKGSAAAANEVMGGQVDMFFLILNEGLGHVRSGRLRALATTGEQRAAHLPEVPTVHEAGVKGFVSETWYGISGPAGMPADLVSRIHMAAIQGMRRPAMRERFDNAALELIGEGTEPFTRHIRSEMEKWSRVIRQSGAKVN